MSAEPQSKSLIQSTIDEQRKKILNLERELRRTKEDKESYCARSYFLLVVSAALAIVTGVVVSSSPNKETNTPEHELVSTSDYLIPLDKEMSQEEFDHILNLIKECEDQEQLQDFFYVIKDKFFDKTRVKILREQVERLGYEPDA